MLADASISAPLDWKEPASRITMDSSAVSVPSAMANRMWYTSPQMTALLASILTV